MITASHNPPADNGLKLWTPSGQAFDSDQRAAITSRIENENYALQPWDGQGTYTEWAGAETRHHETLVAAGTDLSEFEIVVDIGNGAGGVTATALDNLGASVTTLNAQPDGRFPGRPSEPTSETCAGLCAHVGATDAELGIAHDGDADRMLAVDEQGRFVDGDSLLALFGQQAASAGDRIAAPVNTSLAVDDALDAVGASVVRTPVGDVHVASTTAVDDVVFGGEPSGAWIWPTESRCPDGPLAAVRLAGLVASDGPLSALVDALPAYPIARTSIEVELAATDRIMTAIHDRVTESYDDVTTLDGVRVEVDDGWFLIRPSGTQPLIRVTAQARSAERADALLQDARELVEAATR